MNNITLMNQHNLFIRVHKKLMIGLKKLFCHFVINHFVIEFTLLIYTRQTSYSIRFARVVYAIEDWFDKSGVNVSAVVKLIRRSKTVSDAVVKSVGKWLDKEENI